MHLSYVLCQMMHGGVSFRVRHLNSASQGCPWAVIKVTRTSSTASHRSWGKLLAKSTLRMLRVIRVAGEMTEIAVEEGVVVEGGGTEIEGTGLAIMIGVGMKGITGVTAQSGSVESVVERGMMH